MITEMLKDKLLAGTVIYLSLLLLLGIFADQIACEGGIIPFDPGGLSPSEAVYSPPGTKDIDESGDELVHYFGTDQIGRDVASRLIHGIEVAFQVGIWSSIIALLIAILLGWLAGFIGDKNHQLNIWQIVWWTLAIICFHHYAKEFSFDENDRGIYTFFILRYIVIFIPGLLLAAVVSRFLDRLPGFQMYIPWDTVVIKSIEVFRSIPNLFFLLAIFAILTKPSIISVVIIIGIIRWPSLTRITRAEIIRVRQEDFIKSARILGIPNLRLLTHHVLPNIYRPLMVITAFNIGSAILIEASLSFLQIGLPLDAVSWGSMLGDARAYIPAWWMAVGPGLLIFSMILSFNILGDRLSFHFKVDRRQL